MKLTLLSLLLLTATTASANIRTYFNHRQSTSYLDPYKNITRSGDNLEAVILAEIQKARTSIFVAVQEIRLPSIAKELVRKHQAGVAVKVILENGYNHDVLSRPSTVPSQHQENEDPDGSYEGVRYRELVALIDANGDRRITPAEMADRDAVFILNRGGISISDDTSDGTRGSGLMHHKFVVVDGRTTVVSSANFTPSCIHGDLLVAGSRGNANALMVIESAPMARLFTEEFNEMWGGRFGARKRYRGPQTVQVRGNKITVQFSPNQSIIDWSMTTNGLISKTLAMARYSVQSALFVFSEQRISTAMETVQHRAEISVLVDPRFAFRPYSELLDMLGAAVPNSNCRYDEDNNPWRTPLQRGGVPTLNAGDVLHHKFGVVDGRKVIFGSHNWSSAANMTNDEFILVVEDSAAADDFSVEFNRLASRARWGLPANLRPKTEAQLDDCARR